MAVAANGARKRREIQVPVDAASDASSRSFLEVLVWGCRREDVEILRVVCGRGGPRVQVVSKSVEIVKSIAIRLPVALLLGISRRDRGCLGLISAIRALWSELPVLVVAEEDSLELERRVRQQGIFYYFVHPLQIPEVEAVLKNVLHRTRGTGLSYERP